jgi:hypothetical protein
MRFKRIFLLQSLVLASCFPIVVYLTILRLLLHSKYQTRNIFRQQKTCFKPSRVSERLIPNYVLYSRLGGVVVSVLTTGPKGRGFKPGRGDGFWRAIKIRSTPSFGWKVKPEVPRRKILRHVKDPLMYQRYWICNIVIPSSIHPIRSRCLCW